MAEEKIDEIEGWRAWVVVFGSFCVNFVTNGTIFTYSVYVIPYIAEFGTTQRETSVPYILAASLMFTGGLVASILLDKIGAQNTMMIGASLYFTGYMLASTAKEFWVIIVTQGLIGGMGLALCFLPAFSLVPEWFEGRRGTALGIATFGGGVGSLVMAVILQSIIEAYDFRTALQVAGGFGFVLILIGAVTIRPRRTGEERKKGLDFSIFSQTSFKVFLGSACIFQFGYNAPFVYLSPFIQLNGLSAEYAALAVGILGIGSGVGRLLWGIIADQAGLIISFESTAIGTGVSLALWPLCVTDWAVAIFAFFFGFFAGGFVALIPAVMARLYGTERLSGILGFLFVALLPGNIGGPAIVGSIFDVTGDYTGGIIFSALCVFASIPPVIGVLSFRKQVQEEVEDEKEENGEVTAGDV